MMIEIKTALPGPRAQRAIERDHRYVSQSYTRSPQCPVVADRGQGVWVQDVDGNQFLDFAAGLAVCSTGHCHPEVVKAVQDQAAKLIHMSGTDFYYLPQVDLAERLAKLAPGDFAKRVFFGNSGTEAIEAALKLARYKTGRHQFISYFGAFHGRTVGAMSLSGSKIVHRRGFGPLLPGVTHIPYPYCYRCPFGLTHQNCGLACLNYLTDLVFKKTLPPEEVAAIFIEPIQGEGGYVVPPADYMQELQKVAREHGILLVADEVQTGFGRTGKMFAMENFGVVPDLIATAKGLASGLPLGVTIYRSDSSDWVAGSHASTFGGNPLSCTAAIKTVELLESGIMANVSRQSPVFMERLRSLAQAHECMGDVRGVGLMIGVEIVKDRQSKEKDPARRDALLAACYRRGLILIGCGENVVRFAPPLVISREEAEIGLEVFARALEETERAGSR